MKLYAPLFALLLTTPVLAQTATDAATDGDGKSQEAMDTNDLSTRTGSVFYSDDAMMTPRSAEESKTMWSSLSAEDQEALKAQCANMPTEGAQTAETSAPADATSEPALPESEGAEAAVEPAPASTDYVSDAVRMKAVCEAIAAY